MTEHRKLAADLALLVVLAVAGILAEAAWGDRMTSAIHIFFDALLLAAFLIAVISIVAAIQFGLLVGWVTFLQHRYRRQQARRPGYITDDPSFREIYVDRDMTHWQDCRITGSPWRNR